MSDKIQSLAEDWVERFSGLTTGGKILMLEILAAMPGGHPVAKILPDLMVDPPPVLGRTEWGLVADLVRELGPEDITEFCETVLQRVEID